MMNNELLYVIQIKYAVYLQPHLFYFKQLHNI